MILQQLPRSRDDSRRSVQLSEHNAKARCRLHASVASRRCIISLAASCLWLHHATRLSCCPPWLRGHIARLMKRTRGVERPLTIFNPPTSPDPQLAQPTHQQPLPLVWQPNATHASLPQVRLPRVQPRVHLAQSICMAPNYHKPLPAI